VTERYYHLRAGLLGVVAAGILVGYALDISANYLLWTSIVTMLAVSAVEVFTETRTRWNWFQ
jgi:hypothetical protein